jgi:geranylgeranylglycerol-phosphate geranylgeranyltransferase
MSIRPATRTPQERAHKATTDLALPKTLKSLILVVHPFPIIMVAVAGTTFYFLLADELRGLDLAMIFGSILFISASIGSMNDYCDVDLDRHTKSNKPIVRGDILPKTVLMFSCLTAIFGAILSTFFGWKVLLVALVVLASGMAYDLQAKRTIFSWVPYAISISALPIWAFLAADKFTPVVLLTLPLGTLISLAVNLANTLPDLSGDIQYGVKGLAHTLGLRRSINVICCSFGVVIGLLTLTPVALGSEPRRLFPGVILAAILLLVMIVDYAVIRSDASLKRGWCFSAVLAALLGGTWVASLTSG